MNKIFVILLAVLASVILFASGFRAGRKPVRPDTDTVRLNDTVYLSSPEIIREIPVPVPVNIDTAAILKKYFTKRVYNDTIVQTKFVEVHLTDTVYMNGLLGRTASYTFRFPEYNRSFSAGVMGGHRAMTLMAAYRHKQMELLGGYDFVSGSFSVGAKYYLFRW